MKKLLSFILAGTILAVSSVSAVSFASASTIKFKDVSNNHWAKQSIYSAVEKGYFKGYSDGTFRPKANITRAEFAALIARVVDYEVKEEATTFSDLKGHWAESAVQKAVGMGFVKASDYPNGFQPGKALTREEMAKWISSGLAANDTEYKQAWTDTKTTVLPVKEYFKGQISQAKTPFIAIAMGTGLMKGYTDGTFGLTKTTTRAEVSAIVLRLENVLSKSTSSFTDLTELRAVGTEKSNLNLVTPFTTGSSSFSDISGKRFTLKNGSGSIVFHRSIAVDVQDWNNKKSVYSNVFVGEENKSFYTNRQGIYPLFMQITIYPTAKGFSVDHYFNGKANFLTGSKISNTLPNKYGYTTLPNTETAEFFAKHKEGVTLWVVTNLTKDTLGHERMDDGTILGIREK